MGVQGVCKARLDCALTLTRQSGLLPLLDDISERVHISEYKGKRIAVDGYVSANQASRCNEGVETDAEDRSGFTKARIVARMTLRRASRRQSWFIDSTVDPRACEADGPSQIRQSWPAPRPHARVPRHHTCHRL